MPRRPLRAGYCRALTATPLHSGHTWALPTPLCPTPTPPAGSCASARLSSSLSPTTVLAGRRATRCNRSHRARYRNVRRSHHVSVCLMPDLARSECAVFVRTCGSRHLATDAAIGAVVPLPLLETPAWMLSVSPSPRARLSLTTPAALSPNSTPILEGR